MSGKSVRPTLLGVVLGVGCLGLAGVVAAPGEGSGASGAAGDGGSSVWMALGDGEVDALPGGVRRLLADAAWLESVQYYGRRRLAGMGEFPALAESIGQALRFDPGLRPAAVYGALLLSESPPLGAGLAAEGEAMLADWTARHPEDWDALLMRGLVLHWHLRDAPAAARVFAEAGARAGAPDWFSALAARSWTTAGERETARALWAALLERAPTPRAHANAETHLRQLDALDRIEQLTVLVRRFEDGAGRLPSGWGELVEAGLLGAVPLDPAGTPYELGEDGIPRIARISPLAGTPGLPGR